VRAINLIPNSSSEQLSLFYDYEAREKRIRLEDAVEEIRRRFGKRAISYAILMGNLKMPTDGRDLVRMPGIMYQ
jgi:DNA polymerase-4